MASVDRPANRAALTYTDFWSVVTHPAFRLGFLDAQSSRPFDHDAIMERIATETPAGALKRLGFDPGLFSKDMVALAQFRYEEGRAAHLEFGLRCKAWGHPDYPPVAIQRYIETRLRAG